jgi:hypothetical protein
MSFNASNDRGDCARLPISTIAGVVLHVVKMPFEEVT